MLQRVSLILFLVCMVAVFWFSLIPEPPHIKAPVSFWDKIEHFSAYFVLAFFFTIFLRNRFKTKTKLLLTVFLTLAATGALIEFLQRYTGRTPELSDFIANMVGVSFGFGVALITKSQY